MLAIFFASALELSYPTDSEIEEDMDVSVLISVEKTAPDVIGWHVQLPNRP